MATGKSTRPSGDLRGNGEESPSGVHLRFPEDEGFHPLPPEVPLATFVKRNRWFRETFPDAVPTDEERRRARVDRVFRLLD